MRSGYSAESCSRRNSCAWRIAETSATFASPPSQVLPAIDNEPNITADISASSMSAMRSSSSVKPAAWWAPTLAAAAAALPPEQLCCLSRGDCMKTLVPGLTGARHRIENAKQLVRAGGERDLLRFARRKQAVVEGLDHRIEAH